MVTVVASAAVVAAVAAWRMRAGASSAESAAPSSVVGAHPSTSASPMPALVDAAFSALADRADGADGADGAPSGRPWVAASWGVGAGQLGRTRPDEANPEAPMSLAAAGNGLVVLDQVNGRVVRFDAQGNVASTARTTPTTQDVAVTKEGGLALLDRLVSKDVTLVDARGKEIGKLPIQGKGLEDTGLTTGVFVDGNRVYVERGHGALVLVGTTDGTPASDRTELSGRPSRDGLVLISAGITSPERGRVYLNVFDRAKNTLRFTRTLDLQPRVNGIALLDSDARGTVYLGVVRGSEGAQEVRVGCHDPIDGHELSFVTFPTSTMPEETFKDLTVMADGRIVAAVRNENGVEYRVSRCTP